MLRCEFDVPQSRLASADALDCAGVKTLPSDIVVDMRWQEDPEGNVKPAMPFLQVLLSDATHDRLIDVLSGTSSFLYF